MARIFGCIVLLITLSGCIIDPNAYVAPAHYTQVWPQFHEQHNGSWYQGSNQSYQYQNNGNHGNYFGR